MKRIVILSASAVLWAAALILVQNYRILALILFAGAWILAGFPVIQNMFLSLKKGPSFDENVLMTIASIGAFAIGEWEEACGVMIFYGIGELLQDMAVGRSTANIDALLSLRPDTARIQINEEWKEVPADSVEPDTCMLVRPGERIPLDGILVAGSGSMDAALLSGESKPVFLEIGDPVYSGAVSLDGVLTIQSTKRASESSAARIVAMVEHAREAKAKPERFITAFAKRYTPIVVGLAALLAVVPPLILPDATFAEWIHRALVLLVISCPCALVVSIPLGYYAGIGGLSRRGVIVKGASHLDSLAKAQYVAFDKTGTLTEGCFSVTGVEPAEGIDAASLLETAALAEWESNHPIAQAIRAAATISGSTVGERREIAGQGIELHFGTEVILAGNHRFLDRYAITMPQTEDSGTVVYVARNGHYNGKISVGDTLKAGAPESIRRLESLGISETVMLSGDSNASASAVAAQLGIRFVKAELLPADKIVETETLTNRGVTVFVGDGINDAPVLARADVGIAMGGGADVAIESADLIVHSGDPRLVPEAIACSRRIRHVIIENVIFALSFKGVCIVLAAFGIASMWLALLADVGVALIAILNASRLLK
ncbi:hypothetical protein FACS1894164_09220 [Spirochaetia bacterium]|nr:hypothetical protein FACS1894164_09220 [Spirochaetia bacterium]